MATKLFLRSTQANAIGATYFDMVPTAGSSAATAVVNTVASGTEIQWTQTAGGSVIQFVSGRAPSGGFTLTATDISIWAKESNAAANSGGRYRVFKRAANGTETELGGGPFNDGVEFTTSDAEYLWTGNVTDTAFAENDRILLKLYITNVGTMGSGRNCTLTYNGANAATGDSFFNIAETVAFKSESVTHGATGALTGPGSTVAGSADVAPPGVLAIVDSGTGNSTVTYVGGGYYTGEKTGGGNASIVSSVAASGNFVLWYENLTGGFNAVGVNSATPTTNDNWEPITFGWWVNNFANLWYYLLSGTATATGVAPPVGVVIYRLSGVLYMAYGADEEAALAATPVHSAANTDPFYLDSYLDTAGDKVKVRFREIPAVVHAASGALAGQGSTVAGSSVHNKSHASSGALTGQLGSVAGVASSATVRAASGALTGQGSVVSGSASSATSRPSSGALTGQIGSVAGSATRTKQHAASGVLVGQLGSVSGSAAHIAIHAAAGAIAGQIGGVSGTAARTRVHAASGILEGQPGSVNGTAAHQALHASSGVLAGQGSAVAGAAARTRAHAASGILAGLQAAITGDAARASGFVTHAATGVLSASGASVAASAARTRVHAASGILAGIQAAVTGDASRASGAVAHTATGALTGQAASIAAAADRLRAFAAAGALSGQGSNVAGVAARERIHIAAGDLPGLAAIIAGQAVRGTPDHVAAGALAGAGAIIQGAAGVLAFVAPARTTSSGRRLTTGSSGLNETRADNLLRTTTATGRAI